MQTFSSQLLILGMLMTVLNLACSERGNVTRIVDPLSCDARYITEVIEAQVTPHTPMKFLEASQDLLNCADTTLANGLAPLTVERYKKAFLQAMILLKNGRFAESGMLLSDLQSSPDSQEWGLMGMAEHAVQRGHVQDLGLAVALLQARVEANKLASPHWDFLYYKLYFLLELGEYEEAGKILSSGKPAGNSQADTKSTYFEVLQKINTAQYREMESLLSILGASNPDDRDYALFRADIVRIMEGPRRLLEYLGDVKVRHPDDKHVLYQYALALIENDRRDDGVDILRRIVLTLPFDVDILADYVEYQQSKPQTTEAKKALEIIETADVVIPRFELTKARRAYVRNDREEMKGYLDSIATAHPLYEDYLWFLYEIYARAQSFQRCKEVLARLSRVDPNGVDVLVERVRIELELGNRKEARLLFDVLRSSKRFKDPVAVGQIERLLLAESSGQLSH